MWTRFAHDHPEAYGVSFALVGVATAVRAVAGFAVPEVLALFPYFPAVAVAAVYGGRGPGTAAAVMSVLISLALFLEPTRANVINSGLFLAAAFVLVWLAGALRHVVRDLEKRTAALEAAAEEYRTLLGSVYHYGGNNTQKLLTGVRMLQERELCAGDGAKFILEEMATSARTLANLHEEILNHVQPLSRTTHGQKAA